MNYNKIFLENLRYFLVRNKWEERDSNYRGLFVFKNTENNVEILLSKTDATSDFNYHIENAIKIISMIEKKHPDVIRLSIKTLDRDLHNLKVPETNVDSVAINLAEQIIASTRKLFELSAKNELKINPNLVKERKTKFTELIYEYINSCQFAHTWRSSFGFTIEAPLNLPSIGLFDLSENYERKISKRIFNGINIINEGANDNSVDYIVENVEKGFDGRMCYQLVEISEQLKFSSLEYSTVWSPSIKIESDIDNIKSIILDKKTFSYAEKAASKLIKSEDEIRIWFNGFPEGFRSHKEDLFDETTFGEHIIYVRGSSQEIKYAILRMELSLEDYWKALKAHEEGKDVRVDCLVKKKPKGWEVLEIYEFNIM